MTEKKLPTPRLTPRLPPEQLHQAEALGVRTKNENGKPRPTAEIFEEIHQLLQKQLGGGKVAAAPVEGVVVLWESELEVSAKNGAKEIHDEAVGQGLKSRLVRIKDWKKENYQLEAEKNLVLLCVSTTGDGDVPWDSESLRKHLMQQQPGYLASLRYAVVSFGDSNYEKFANAGKVFDELFQRLGGAAFSPIGLVDKTKDNAEFKPWLAQTLAAAKKIIMPAKALPTPRGQPRKPVREIVVLWESELEQNAKGAAARIDAEASKYGVTSSRVRVLDWKKNKFQVEDVEAMIVVMSTTGDGDPPYDTRSFEKHLAAQQPGFLKGVRFAALGYGDSSYAIFNGGVKKFEEIFDRLGATRLCESCYCDSQKNNTELDPWLEKVFWPSLKGGDASSRPMSAAGAGRLEVTLGDTAAAKNAMQRNISQEGLYDSDFKFMASVAKWRRLTTPDSHNLVYHMELDIAGSNMRYKAGDCIVIAPHNDPVLVGTLLKRCGIDGARTITSIKRTGGRRGSISGAGSDNPLSHVKTPCTVAEAFQDCIELTQIVSPNTLRGLATSADKDDAARLRHLASEAGEEEYRNVIVQEQLNVVDILEDFPSCKPTLENLLELLPPIRPRYYSIASSPKESPDAIHIAFSVVRYQRGAKKRTKNGVCTNWLCSLLPQDAGEGTGALNPDMMVPVFPKPGNKFYMPEDQGVEMIMVCAGTGIAPMRSFLQERRALRRDKGNDGGAPSWLIFGCRNEKKNYLYAEEYQEYLADGTLSRLTVAFSGDSDKKVYVNNKMEEEGKDIYAKLSGGRAALYVCGSNSLGRGVYEALVKIYQEHGQLSVEDAKARVTELEKSGLYKKDTWG